MKPARVKTPETLRSARWFAPDDLRSFGHRSRMMQMGYAEEDYAGRPVIAIINTWSDLQPCHTHFKQRVEDVKRGILHAGGFPVELPAISLAETYVKPTTMMYRNMLAMETEELLRSHPVDGAVLMGGCDKTGPALLMGATSAGIPAIFIPAGPMLRGNYKGTILGSGSDSWKYWDERRAGKLSKVDWLGVEGGIARSHGTCMTMGTASTMTAIIEAIGMSLPGLMTRLRGKLHLVAMTVSGKTIGENIAHAQVHNDDVIRTLDNALYDEGALAVLKGNLAPDGCVIKPSACEPRFLKHTGPALVFDDYPSMKKAVDDPDLDVTADHVLILRNAGPQGGPGMPEWGMLPIPTKLVKQGVRDMVRLSDARMSGTSYGACILHVSPESYIGGPLALVRNGDMITLDVAARSINLEVPEAELAKRRAAWKQPETRFERGYGWMFTRHIRQANEGCDFDFLETSFGAPVGEPSIY